MSRLHPFLLILTLVVIPLLPHSPPAVAAERGRNQPKTHFYDRVYVLAIGIDKYEHPDRIRTLAHAESDARGISALFTEHYGYATELLLGSTATRTAIFERLEHYSSRLKENDALIVYFAGHGQRIEHPEHGASGYLVPFNADLDLQKTKREETWRKEAIGMAEIVETACQSHAKHVLILIDSCCSGFVTHRGQLMQRPDLQELAKLPSRFAISATTEKQPALEDQIKGYGVFTKALIDQLRSSRAASTTEVFVNIRKKVVQNSKRVMLPLLGRIGDRPDQLGEFVFIPLSIRAKEVTAALQDANARWFVRGAEFTSPEDVFDAFQAIDYRFTTDPIGKEKLWQGKFKRFKQNAVLSDPYAMAALHYCFSKGLGTEKDSAEAARWARLAQDTRTPVGKHVMARCLLNGIGMQKNELAGWKLIQEAAEQDFPISQISLANKVLHEGKPTDARKLAEKASKAGLPWATLFLAELYAGQLPSGLDVNKAIQLFHQAAEAGVPQANYMLANIYSRGGPGDPPMDLAQAFNWVLRAAEEGDAAAQHCLAVEYHGLGTRRFPINTDYTEARKWAELAAHQDYAASQMVLARIYELGHGVPINYARAKQYCEAAAANNWAEAFTKQGLWYLAGHVYPQDDRKAKHALQKAASMGSAYAWTTLGAMYEELRDVALNGNTPAVTIRLNRHHAIHCFIQAMKHGGNDHARDRLREIVGEQKGERTLVEHNLTQYYHGEITPSMILQNLEALYPESAKEFRRRLRSPKPTD